MELSESTAQGQSSPEGGISPHNTSGGDKKKSSGGLSIIALVVLVIVALWAVVNFTDIKIPFISQEGEKEGPSQVGGASDVWHAVFLTNGQVYFGRLKNPESQYPLLEEVYYLQVQQQQIQPPPSQGQIPGEGVVSAPQTQPQLVLIKFGTELHRPADWMRLNRDHILFWEEMTADSRVVQSIEEYKKQPAAQPGQLGP